MNELKLLSSIFRILAIVIISHAGTLMFAQQDVPEKYGGTLSIGFNTEPSSLAPWRSGDANTHRIYSALYETLVGQYETLEIAPGLAERWEVSDDGTIYTFYLHEGVRFHNGEEFNAQVAKWNMDRWADAPDGYIYGLSGIKSSEVVDDYTFQVTLEAPNNMFLVDLASGLQSILPPQAVDELGEGFSFSPVGTGPFKFERWITDSEIVLVRNTDYWREDDAGNTLPYLDQIVFKTLPDASTRHTALITGDIDIDTSVGPENVADLEARDAYVVYNQPGVGHMVLRLLTTKPPLDDRRVRQAIAWAIDREAINQAAYFGLAETGSGMYSSTTPGYDPEYNPYSPRNLGRARELLAEAGYADGFSMEMIVATPIFQIVAEVMQAQLAEIGINVTIRNLERGIYLDGIVDRLWESYPSSITARIDPYQFYSHLECNAAYNGHDYCNEQLDRMVLVDGLANYTDTLDPERIALYQEAQRIVVEDAPLVVVLYPPTLYAWSAAVHDITVNPAGRIYWFATWKGGQGN